MYVENQNEDEDKKNNLATEQGGASIGAGGGIEQPGSNPSTLNPVQSNKPQQTLATAQDYFSANKPQSDALGQKFTDKLDASGSQDKSAIAGAAQKTQSDIAANTITGDSALTKKAVSDPTAVANNAGDLNSFLNQWNAQYKGPASFEASDNYSEATKAADDAAQKSAELSSAGGQQQILQDQFGVYGQGNQSLDQGLLQNSSYAPKVQEQQKAFQSIPDYLKAQAQTVSDAATAAKATTDQTRTDTQGAFANSLTGFQNDLTAKTTAAQATANAATDKYKTALSSNDPAKIIDALGATGITPEQKASLTDYLTTVQQSYGLKDLSGYVGANPNADVTNSNVASAADYEKAQALQKLTGVDYGGVLNPADASKAGTWNTVDKSVDANGISQDLRNYLIQQQTAKNSEQPTGSSTQSSSGSNNKTKEQLAGAAAVLNPVTALTSALPTAVLAAGIKKISDPVQNFLGIGGGKKDAVVNLPEMTLPAMAVPSKADAHTTQQIVDVFTKPIDTGGSYHENSVYDVVNRLDTLKQAYQKGQLTDKEYNDYSQPLAKWATQAFQSIMGASSQGANAAKPAYNKFVAGQYLNK